MRLTTEEVAAIKTAAAEAFGPDAVVRLFGSRVHDHLRGGDIDLHVEAPELTVARDARTRFVAQLHRTIGERSIDVLVQGRDSRCDKFDLEARRTGVVL